MSDALSFARILSDAVNSRLAEVHTAMPGRVESYDKATQRADIKPLLKRAQRDVDGNEMTVESLPVIAGVPVMFPRAGDYFISLPLAKGNTGLLIFSERNIDQWIAKGGEVDPRDLRLFPLDGAAFYPGLWADGAKLSDADGSNIVVGKTGGTQIHIADGTISLGEKSPSDAIALASLVKQEVQKITDWITNTFVPSYYAAHSHTTGTGPSGPPTPPVATFPAACADVKSTVVKAK